MASIGAFGAAQVEAERNSGPETFDTFEFLGSEFRIANHVSPAILFDIGASSSEDFEIEGNPAALGLVKLVVKTCTQAEDFPRLWALFRRDRGDWEKLSSDLAALARALFEHVMERPTAGGADSSGGPSSTGSSSKPTSSTDPISGTPVGPFTAAPGETPLPEGTILVGETLLYPDGTGGYTPSRPGSA